MNTKVLQFLSSHRVCALSVVMPDGASHSAALHYSHSDSPLALIFSTDKNSKKAKAVADGRQAQASVVIGLSEEEWITIQLDGNLICVTDNEELERIKPIHYAKHPKAQQFEADPDTIFLKFEPAWWRYTDASAERPEILSSE